ncbi:MAG: hypothetical protein ACLT2T_10000 [Bilophila wadsworthia]
MEDPPVTSILVATIILAISIGTPWDKIEGIINKGMADTLKSIAIVIVLGCILSKVLEETSRRQHHQGDRQALR